MKFDAKFWRSPREGFEHDGQYSTRRDNGQRSSADRSTVSEDPGVSPAPRHAAHDRGSTAPAEDGLVHGRHTQAVQRDVTTDLRQRRFFAGVRRSRLEEYSTSLDRGPTRNSWSTPRAPWNYQLFTLITPPRRRVDPSAADRRVRSKRTSAKPDLYSREQITETEVKRRLPFPVRRRSL